MNDLPPGPLVLVIEDELPIRRFLRTTLAAHGYRLEEAGTGAEGIHLMADHPADLVILDLTLPDVDGLEVTRRLREWTQVPIIVLSARGLETDKIAALDMGADDYVTKPFATGELLARLRAALRRRVQVGEAGDGAVYAVGDLRVDLALRRVWVGEHEVHLTPTEYRLLAVLVQYAGRVMTHQQLLRAVWGPSYATESHYVRLYMAQLRHKLEADPARPRYLLTELGVGYRLASE